MSNSVRFVSLFSGIGNADAGMYAAAHALGISVECVAAFDSWDEACEIYNAFGCCVSRNTTTSGRRSAGYSDPGWASNIAKRSDPPSRLRKVSSTMSTENAPEHPEIIMTAADVIQERMASASDGTEPDITPTNFGNQTAEPEGPDVDEARRVADLHAP